METISVHADSGAAPIAVWNLLADATTWPAWGRFAEAVYLKEGTPAPHGVGAVRRFRVGPLRSAETVLTFEPPEHLGYDYSGPLPIADYRAEVSLSPSGTGTHIEWRSTFRPKVPLTGPLLRAFLARVLQDTATRLARAAERQDPHPPAD